MQILGGFIAVLGVAAVALAFACTGTWVIPVMFIGVAAIVGGYGLFAEGRVRNNESLSPDFAFAGSQILI